MSQLILPKDTFYILESTLEGSGLARKENSIHIAMDTAILKINEYIGKNVQTDKISLYKVTIEPQQLSAIQIPWSTIAVELVKAGSKK